MVSESCLFEINIHLLLSLLKVWFKYLTWKWFKQPASEMHDGNNTTVAATHTFPIVIKRQSNRVNLDIVSDTLLKDVFFKPFTFIHRLLFFKKFNNIRRSDNPVCWDLILRSTMFPKDNETCTMIIYVKLKKNLIWMLSSIMVFENLYLYFLSLVSLLFIHLNS